MEILRDAHFLLLGRTTASNHVGIQVVGDGGGAGQGQTGNHGHDGGEGHSGQEAEQEAATHGVGQVNRRHVGAADQVLQHVEAAVGTDVEELRMTNQQSNRAEADDEGQDVEVADEAARPDAPTYGLPWRWTR